MPRLKKNDSSDTGSVDENKDALTIKDDNKNPRPHDIEWTDYVLGFLSDDEKISGNPTTDGLRRIFETVLDCVLIDSKSEVVQSPSPENEKRATVVYTLVFILNNEHSTDLKKRSVTGAADVYWGNCDKVYRNHPVAVAETRAEGRALRRALKLRKVVAAEELAKDIEDHPDSDTVSKITNNQLNFIDVLSKRLDINVIKMIEKLGYETQNIYNIEHASGVEISKSLSSYQQNVSNIPEDIRGYNNNWK